MQIFFFLLAFFSSSMLSSMEQNEQKSIAVKDPKEGLTIGDACQIWGSHAPKAEWDLKRSLQKFGIASAVTLVFPGLLPSAVMCLITCYGYFKNQTQSQLCLTGLSLYSVPLLTGLCTLAVYPVVKLQNRWAQKQKDDWQERIDEFAKKHLLVDFLSNSEMRQFANMIFLSGEPFLKKLNIEQAMMLAEADFNRFQEIFKFLNEETRKYARKMILMYEMSTNELVPALADEQIHRLFIDYPCLWQALARILPKKTRNDGEIKTALIKSLGILLNGYHLNYKNTDKIFNQISSGTVSLNNILLREVEVLDLDKSEADLIEIKTSIGSKMVSKKNLIAVSGHFKEIFSDTDASVVIDLAKIDVPQEWGLFVVDVAMGEPINISLDNVLETIQAASYFQIKYVISQCDNFLAESNRLQDLLLAKKKDHMENQHWWNFYKDYFLIKDQEPLSANIPSYHEPAEENDFKKLWQFCFNKSLTKCRSMLIRELADKLNNIDVSDVATLDNIRLLNDEDKEILGLKFNKLQFEKKLGNAKFFKFIWVNAQDILLLQNALLDFCLRHDRHALEKFLEIAWVFIPQDLIQAIEAHGSK